MTDQPPSAPPQYPVPPAQKKGMSGWAWAGIGCGFFLLIVVISIAAVTWFGVKKYKEFSANKEQTLAELVIATHPDLEKVSSDPTKHEITVRSKSGEEYTVNYKEITEGRFSFKDTEGNITRLGGSSDFSELPPWVPQVPAISGKPSVFLTVTGGKTTGLYNATTTASVEDTDAFFKAEAEKAGFSSSSNTSSTWGGTQNLSRSYSDATREISITVTGESGKPVHVQVSFSEK